MQDFLIPPSLGVQSLAQWSRGSPWRLDLLHAHDHDLLYWITRGQGRMILRGQRSGLGAHNAVFVPAGSLHSIDLGKQGFGLVLILPDATSLGFGQEPRHLRVRDQQSQIELTALLDAMQREKSKDAPLMARAMAAHAQLVAVWMQRQEIEPPATKTDAATRLVAAYAARLAHHHRSGESMAAHAAALGVTPTHLSRSCKHVCGLSAAEMQTQVTLHAARSLIEDSDAPLNRIADYLGFGSPAYFSRFIQAQTGQPPSALRHAARATSQSRL